MATATEQQQTAKELFYSYSHKDAELRDELERHLSVLKRSGLVHMWYDRAIDAGSEWAGQIDEHLAKADLILLLISADFLASDYCYDVEMKRALERHEAGTAVVIAIILRPVDWSGAPFATLQCLPSRAVPITSWANRDEAFRDVAEGIRRAILKATRPPPGTVLRERAVDAAMPSTVPVGTSAGLLVMVRRMTSSGLRGVLRIDDTYEVSEQDVRSKPFQMAFSRNEWNQLAAEVLTVRLESNDFEIPCPSKQLAIPPEGDSDTCVFLVSPKHAGRLQLLVEVLHEQLTVATHLLRTSASAMVPPDGPVPYVLAVLPLIVYARQVPEGAGEFTRMFGAPSTPSPQSKPTGTVDFTRVFAATPATRSVSDARQPADTNPLSAEEPTATQSAAAPAPTILPRAQYGQQPRLPSLPRATMHTLPFTLGAAVILLVVILYFLVWR